LHAYGLLLVLFAVRSLHLIGCIDYAAPVLRIQRQLAELRRWRTRVEWPLFGIVGCFIWIPLLLVIFRDNEGSALEKYASGRSIRTAQEELDALARFEQE
jgi:hypothetical protein